MATSDFTAEAVSPPRRGWWRRNWLWVVPSGCLVAVLLAAGLCAGIIFGAMGMLKSSEPYQMALEQVRQNPKVIEALGEPIQESGWFPAGNLKVENDRGEAQFDFDVAGPKGKAHVRSQARLIDGKWGLTTLEVTGPDGKRLPLETGAAEAAGMEEAPRWTPPKKP